MNESKGPERLEHGPRPYERPNVRSLAARELIELLGVPLALYGDPGGGTSP